MCGKSNILFVNISTNIFKKKIEFSSNSKSKFGLTSLMERWEGFKFGFEVGGALTTTAYFQDI